MFSGFASGTFWVATTEIKFETIAKGWSRATGGSNEKPALIITHFAQRRSKE
jgi:hypothetical protein